MMTTVTRRLWFALRHPPLTNPVFQRTCLTDAYTRRLMRVVEALAPATLLLGSVLVVAMWVLPSVTLLPRLFLVWGVAPLAFIVLDGTLFGALWAGAVGRAIADEYMRKRYDLLCLSPSGVWGVNWALCTACLYRNGLFEVVHTQRKSIIYRVLLPASALLVLGFALSAEERGAALFSLTIAYGCTFIVLMVDYMHSMVTCSLSGILAPALARNTLNAPLWALGIFLLVQLAVYVTVAVLDLAVLPTLYSGWNLNGIYADISLALVRLALYLIVRELASRALWRVTLHRLNLDKAEFSALLAG